MRRRGQMKYRMPMLALVALLGAAFALAFAGCADQADVTSETVEEPGELIEPGIDAEEMTTDTPAHVREDQEDPQGPTEPGVESDELDPIETGPTGGGVDVEEMTDDTPPHTEDN
jgi:hypothetical protein